MLLYFWNNLRLLQNPSGVFCKREVRIQKTGYRIIEHVDRERVTILNTEFWLLNTALAEPTKEVLQAPQFDIRCDSRRNIKVLSERNHDTFRRA